MGYESRIIVASRYIFDHSGEIWFEKLGEMWLSKCGYGFPEIFTTEIESNIYGDGFKMNSDEEIELTEDKYGDICKYAPIQTVIDWLEKAEAKEAEVVAEEPVKEEEVNPIQNMEDNKSDDDEI